jgi:dinuclear metal center YbgI/SA1388 family protein
MKAARVIDVVAALETIAPVHLAEEWDNIGLQLGSRQWPAHRILTALEVTPHVIDEARQRQGEVLVTHHPLFFRPLRFLDLDTPLGNMLQDLCVHRIAVIAAHTNLDSVRGGVSDILSSSLEIEHTTVLQPSKQGDDCGLGRIGNLAATMRLDELSTAIKSRLALPFVRFAGNPDLVVRRVALCSGSGSSLIEAFLASDAQVFITGDVRYHDARTIEWHGQGVIDIGHYESEHIILDTIAAQLAERITGAGLKATVAACQSERAPFTTI